MQTFILITIVVIATIHLMMASVLSLYSRYKVQYLSLAWIMGIFGALCCVAIPFSYLLRFENIGLLHPFMLLALVGTCFLQGIYPLSIPMPGYLQWGRMWRYASPAIFLIILYVASLLLGNRPVIVHTYSELAVPSGRFGVVCLLCDQYTSPAPVVGQECRDTPLFERLRDRHGAEYGVLYSSYGSIQCHVVISLFLFVLSFEYVFVLSDIGDHGHPFA